MAGAHFGGPAAEFLYFGTQDDGTFATKNAGAVSPSWTNQDCCDSFDVASDSSQVLYTSCCFPSGRFNRLFLRGAGMTGGGEINTYPGGTLPGFTFVDVVDRFGANSYVVMTTSGIFVTTDITATPIAWTQLGAATTPANACGVRASGTVFYVQAGTCSGSSADRLWRYSGTSAGSTWQQINPPAAGGGFGIFTVDPRNSNRLFASVIPPLPADPQMVLSTDGGVNWANNSALDALMVGNGTFRYRNTRGPTNFAAFGGYVQPTLVAFSTDDSTTLLAGGADSGIFLSTDNGSTWTIVTNNSGIQSGSGTPSNPHIPRPRFAYFDREGGFFNVYVGTQGRGVWRLRYDDPVGACQLDCRSERDECMAEVSQPGGPRPQLCVQLFRACVAFCQNP
jgi:hypothetical protein